MPPQATTPIPGFPGYFITRDGHVWSERGRPHRRGHWVRPSLGRGGYQYLGLYHADGRRASQIAIHSLVLLAYVGPPAPDQLCRHLNGNKFDNRVENLTWGTYRENAADALRHGTRARGETSGTAKLTGADVCAIRAAVAAGEDRRAIAARYGVTTATVSHIALRQTWRHLD